MVFYITTIPILDNEIHGEDIKFMLTQKMLRKFVNLWSLSGEGAADVLRRKLAGEAKQAALEYGPADVDDDDGGEDENEEGALPVVGVLDEGHGVGKDEEHDDQGQADQ